MAHIKTKNFLAQRALPRTPETLTILCAHPDDEILFFLGWIRTLRPAKLRLICATGDFGPETEQRRIEFENVAQQLGGEPISLGLEDRRGPRRDPVGVPLDRKQLDATLQRIDHVVGDPVLSHGPIGEYGHPHHVDVFAAAWRRFGEDFWCAAGPLESHEFHGLGEACADEKFKLIKRLYASRLGIDGWGCGEELLCHVASSRFSPLFGYFGSSPMPVHPDGPTATLITDFFECLERCYVGPNRKLPAVVQTVYDHWPDPLLNQWLEARIDDWRRELSRQGEL